MRLVLQPQAPQHMQVPETGFLMEHEDEHAAAMCMYACMCKPVHALAPQPDTSAIILHLSIHPCSLLGCMLQGEKKGCSALAALLMPLLPAQALPQSQ